MTVSDSKGEGLDFDAQVRIGARTLGSGEPCFVIAEAGVNHNGSLTLAHQLIDVAADAGADAVKFQTFDPDLLTGRNAETAAYQARATGAERQRDMLASLVLPTEAWAELAHHAGARGLVFLSTAFDLGSAEVLASLGVPALKVPSGELDNLPFIAALAAMGLPLLVSTGMATQEEVADAMGSAQSAPGVCLFHCVSAYPAPIEDANLRAIPAMRSRFGVPVGWSDHSEDEITALAAVALGASMVEKHITMDRSLAGPDHAASADPGQMARYVEAIRRVESAMGDGVKSPRSSEREARRVARRSLHAARELTPGDVLRPGDAVALRPATGLPPATSIEGLRVARSVAEGAPITVTDVEPPGGGVAGA